MKEVVLCFDFGAGSGRLMAVCLEGSKLSYEELYRFSNEPVQDGEFLRWDSRQWLDNMREGLARAYCKHYRILGVAVDTWGVDLVYFDNAGKQLGEPFCYRDERTKKIVDELHSVISYTELYALGGNSYFHFNSIYQLYYDYHINPLTKNKIASFVFTPDYLLHCLGAELSAEYTIASTSAMTDVRLRNWNELIIKKVNIPSTVFPKIVEAPKIAGYLKSEFIPQSYTAIHKEKIPLIKVASHDSASAVASINLAPDACYLLCGTWCMLGIESPVPFNSPEANAEGIANEGNPFGQYRVFTLFPGFWILQRLRLEWNNDGADLSYADFQKMARLCNLRGKTDLHFDLAHDSLTFPQSMEKAVRDLLPSAPTLDKNDLLYIVYRSMALLCAHNLKKISKVTKKSILHIMAVGGGIQDSFFIEEVALQTGLRVEKGAIEASVLGNAGLQFIALGKVKDLASYRALVKANIQ